MSVLDIYTCEVPKGYKSLRDSFENCSLVVGSGELNRAVCEQLSRRYCMLCNILCHHIQWDIRLDSQYSDEWERSYLLGSLLVNKMILSSSLTLYCFGFAV